jgi:hypothetical protein
VRLFRAGYYAFFPFLAQLPLQHALGELVRLLVSYCVVHTTLMQQEGILKHSNFDCFYLVAGCDAPSPSSSFRWAHKAPLSGGALASWYPPAGSGIRNDDG